MSIPSFVCVQISCGMKSRICGWNWITGKSVMEMLEFALVNVSYPFSFGQTNYEAMDSEDP
jgi:hypothetical protein